MRLGDTIDITFTVRDETTLVDADALDIRVRDPNDAETAFAYPGASVTRLSLGVYRLRMTIPESSEAGTWRCRVRATGTVSGSGTTAFDVMDAWS